MTTHKSLNEWWREATAQDAPVDEWQRLVARLRAPRPRGRMMTAVGMLISFLF